jgi:hypothetical protein
MNADVEHLSQRYNPSMSAEDFCGLSVAERAELAEHGYRFEAMSCIRFLDTFESSPWFFRHHELLGYVFAVCDGGAPIRPEEVLRIAAETFGPCDVMWCGR